MHVLRDLIDTGSGPPLARTHRGGALDIGFGLTVTQGADGVPALTAQAGEVVLAARDPQYRVVDSFGVTMWGATINTALDAIRTAGTQGTVYIEALPGFAPYDLEEMPLIPSGTKLRGDGIGRTVLQMADGTNLARMIQTDPGAADVVISDMTLDGNQANNQDHTALQDYMVAIDNGARCVAERVEVKNWFGRWFSVGVGIAQIGNCVDCTVRHCRMENLGAYVLATLDFRNADGIFMGTVRPVAEFNRIHQITDTGIVAENSEGTVIVGNVISDSTQGIAAGGGGSGTSGRGGVVSGNTVYRCRTEQSNGFGIYLYRFFATVAHSFVAANNVVEDGVNGGGMLVQQCDYVSLVGNVVTNQGGSAGSAWDGQGIVVYNSRHVHCVGNLVAFSGSFGFVFAGIVKSLIAANEAVENMASAPTTGAGMAILKGPVSPYGGPDQLTSTDNTVLSNKSTGANQGLGFILFDDTDWTFTSNNDFRGNANNSGWTNASSGTNNRMGLNSLERTVDQLFDLDRIRITEQLQIALNKVMQFATGFGVAQIQGTSGGDLDIYFAPGGRVRLTTAALDYIRFQAGQPSYFRDGIDIDSGTLRIASGASEFTSSELRIGGNKVVGARQGAIANASGSDPGDVPGFDNRARTTANACAAALRAHGLIAP